MDSKSRSIINSIAEHYFHDACDFAGRFDVLWESQTHKTGRIKSFVDLLMSAECALKAHIFLGHEHDDPKEIYTRVRRCSHRIGTLADTANYLLERTHYESIKTQVGDLSVLIRYSLDAYDIFFPLLAERAQAKFKYASTIGNNSWVLGARATVGSLIDCMSSEFTGPIEIDIELLLESEQQMRRFMDTVGK